MSEVILTRAELDSALLAQQKQIEDFCKKAEGELKESGKVSTETKAAIDAMSEKGVEIGKKLDQLEAAVNRKIDGADGRQIKSYGQQLAESDEFKAMQSRKSGVARIEVKTAIVNATPAMNQPLVAGDRLGGIVFEPNRRLTVRDLLMKGRTNSNIVFYAKENTFTNSAAPQYDASPGSTENVVKAESGITFTSGQAAVITLAHWIPVSKQVLEDAPMLQSYIDSRLMYGLKLKEEDEILNAVGTAGNLNGLMNQATAYTRGHTNDTQIDTLRRAMTQGAQSEYSMSGIVLNPADWEAIELTKDSQSRYIVADPQSIIGPTLWGKPVVVTNSMTAGSFLVASFDQAAQIWDREDMSVALSFENSDNFVRNMATILCEERLTLTVYRTKALIKGTF